MQGSCGEGRAASCDTCVRVPWTLDLVCAALELRVGFPRKTNGVAVHGSVEAIPVGAGVDADAAEAARVKLEQSTCLS